MLNTLIHGEDTAEPPLLIAHGLFGSARNWGVLAKRLSDTRRVLPWTCATMAAARGRTATPIPTSPPIWPR
jgi:pimeloyl-ACP methyl ester carboxylesterase